ncbi:hypothetical protein [Mycolicibacterium wolinskyi]|uniref:hypothetical protein n=1 Tax=Mycolicibacterium wolinskyi TaxID=59750 RepID=UPI0039178732
MVAEHVARRAVQIITAALADLHTVVSVHRDMAPASTGHVHQHLAAIAGDTLGWLERWPS